MWWGIHGRDIQDLWEGYGEHLKEPSPIYGQSNHLGHSTISDNFIIIGRMDHGLAIKESIYIRVNNPTLNRNVGKYSLHHKWDRVLFNTPGLRIINDNRHANRTSFSGHAQFIPINRHAHRTMGHTGHAQTWWHPVIVLMKACLQYQLEFC